MTNLKRPPKKRRKKKPSSANPNSSNSSSGTGTLLTTINGNSDHRGSTDSGENEKNNVLQAITILQRSEGQANGFSEGPLDSTTEPAGNSAEMEDSEEVLYDDQTPDPNAEHVNYEPVELEQDQKVTEIEAEIIPEDAKILVRLFIIVIVHSFLKQCFARSKNECTLIAISFKFQDAFQSHNKIKVKITLIFTPNSPRLKKPVVQRNPSQFGTFWHFLAFIKSFCFSFAVR